MVTLKTRSEFQKVMSTGKSFSSRFFHAYILTNSLTEFRVGFIASKKSFPRAVDRNFVKRRCREILRMRTDLKGLDIVVIIKKQALTTDFKTFTIAFNNLK